ncbi:MAG TPA: DUF4188 domain-containing protein [Trichocoleus sp.]
MSEAIIYPGRYTAETNQPFVVFLIGMRVNQPWQFRKWMSVASAMPPMLKTLHANAEEKGFLGAEQFFRLFPLTTMMVSYWRSFEDLERFARSPEDPHLAAWQNFMRQVGKDGSVGIFHETYQIQPGQYECIYGNMPQFGLAAATQHVPIAQKTERACDRMNQPSEQAHTYTTASDHTESLVCPHTAKSN